MSTKTSRMKAGDTYTVKAGEFAGQTATIIDPKPFPDTDHRRRKITVQIEDEVIYLLPRLLEHPSPTYNNVVTIPQQDGWHLSHPSTGAPVFIPSTITSIDDPRLDPWRPSESLLKEYVSRTMPNGEKDVDFLLHFWENRENIMLVGDTQAGKTMLVQVMAVVIGKLRGSKPLPVFTLSGSSGISDFDLFGQVTSFTTPDGRERLVDLPGVVDLATRAGGILYLDEINMMSERVTSSLHPLTDARRAFVNRNRAVRFEHEGTEVFMPDVVEANADLWVVGTMNPGYKGAGALQEAFTNRFRWLKWDYDETTEKRLIPSAAVRLLGQALREARANRSLNTPVGTSALRNLCIDVERFGVETGLWMFSAMFTPQEQPKVQAIITDRSVEMLLRDEQQAKQPQPQVPSYDSDGNFVGQRPNGEPF